MAHTITSTRTTALVAWFEATTAANPLDAVADTEDLLASLLMEQGYCHRRHLDPQAQAERRAHEAAVAWASTKGISEDALLTGGFRPASELIAEAQDDTDDRVAAAEAMADAIVASVPVFVPGQPVDPAIAIKAANDRRIAKLEADIARFKAEAKAEADRQNAEWLTAWNAFPCVEGGHHLGRACECGSDDTDGPGNGPSASQSDYADYYDWAERSVLLREAQAEFGDTDAPADEFCYTTSRNADGTVRDSQRRRCYEWQWNEVWTQLLGPSYAPSLNRFEVADCDFLTMDEVRSIVERICGDWQVPVVPVRPANRNTRNAFFRKTFRIHEMKSDMPRFRSWYADQPGHRWQKRFPEVACEIALPAFIRHLPALLHEVAHYLVFATYGHNQCAGHGPEFVAIYIQLLHRYAGLNAHQMLKTASEWRVKVADFDLFQLEAGVVFEPAGVVVTEPKAEVEVKSRVYSEATLERALYRGQYDAEDGVFRPEHYGYGRKGERYEWYTRGYDMVNDRVVFSQVDATSNGPDDDAVMRTLSWTEFTISDFAVSERVQGVDALDAFKRWADRPVAEVSQLTDLYDIVDEDLTVTSLWVSPDRMALDLTFGDLRSGGWRVSVLATTPPDEMDCSDAPVFDDECANWYAGCGGMSECVCDGALGASQTHADAEASVGQQAIR